MTKFSVEATPNVGVATAFVMWISAAIDARDHDEVGERDARARPAACDGRMNA